MRKLTIVSTLLLLLVSLAQAREKSYSITSPDGRTSVVATIGDEISFTAYHNKEQIIASSVISMKVGEQLLGEGCTVKSAKKSSVDRVLSAPFYKASSVKEHYNQIDILMKEGFGIIFRVYDEGFAYRFYNCNLKKGDKVMDEVLNLRFNEDCKAWFPYSTGTENPFKTSFENRYDETTITGFKDGKYAFSPILLGLENGVRIGITEADLEDYPGMFLVKDDSEGVPALKSAFAPVPAKVKVTPTRCQEIVEEYSDVLAEISSNSSRKNPRFFPWRAFIIADNDVELLSSNLVWLLSSPSRINDISWIKPGKVAWDWWNDWGISGVDFKAGINTETYKHYIDFAAANGIEYVVLDEGWSPSRDGDIMKVIPEIDLPELIKYASSKDVDLILWAVAFTLDKKLEKACKHYSKMGIKGLKVDFMDRDDQEVVRLNWRIAETAAKYNLLVDLHGMYKPAGMNRTWPNVINFEGVWGLEQMKWSKEDMMVYDETFPYIRMLSGPVDYTQGAMRNSTKGNYYPNYSNPMSQGTRAHQVAEYVIFDSPLVMLCDNPTVYTKEQQTTDFITSIPTVWDETRGLQGEIGKYIVTARRSGDKWYIGGTCGWEGKEVTLDLKFIGRKNVSALIYRDGPNVEKQACDYKIEKLNINTNKPFNVRMAAGGGFVIIIE